MAPVAELFTTPGKSGKQWILTQSKTAPNYYSTIVLKLMYLMVSSDGTRLSVVPDCIQEVFY